MDYKIGIGQDSHKFVKGFKPLILGGVTIPKQIGLQANSDGDVVIHSLCNALMTALGKGSFSIYADPLYNEGITDSTKYLKRILLELKKSGYFIHNLAISVEAGKPILEDFNNQIRESLGTLLGISSEKIGLAFTSGERLTSFGKGLGIQAIVVALIVKK